ncbi:MAG: hypothetical protein CL843_02620 [Crocinitomicaceae bacterium]|nr:hypothetical protein [Crocinitomicaceae bacterium]
MKQKQQVNTFKKVTINNSEQWLLIRGKDANAPLLLHVQAGPGLPIVPEAQALEKALHLEDYFLVAYWDQRACGKSFNKQIDSESITLNQLSDDILACAKYLLDQYNKQQLIVLGQSIGATLSLMAAAKDSSMFSQLFLASIDVNIPEANDYALEFARAKAQELGKGRLTRQIERLAQKSITTSKPFQERAKIITDLGGMKTGTTYNQMVFSTVKNMLASKHYSLSDISKTIKGMAFSQDALLPELNTFILSDVVQKVNMPVHFMHGKQDGISPFESVVAYYNQLKAPKKSFTAFEHSAHMLVYEEPEKLKRLLLEQQLA